jgi:hypothetical protein
MAGQAGTDRWIMTGGIFLVAGCYLVTAAGLAGVRAPARALLIVAGLAGIGVAASPEPAGGTTARHLAWTVLGAVTTTVWPAFAAPRTAPRPLILTGCGSAAVTAVFVALLGWLFIETRDGSVLGLAERLMSSIQTCWPFIIAITVRRTRRPAPGAGPGPKRDTATTQPAAGNRKPRPQPAPHPAGARNQEGFMTLTDPWSGYYDTPSGDIQRPGLGPGQPAGGRAAGSRRLSCSLIVRTWHPRPGRGSVCSDKETP